MRQEFCFNFLNNVKFDYIELKGLNASEPSKSRSYNSDFKVKKKTYIIKQFEFPEKQKWHFQSLIYEIDPNT